MRSTWIDLESSDLILTWQLKGGEISFNLLLQNLPSWGVAAVRTKYLNWHDAKGHFLIRDHSAVFKYSFPLNYSCLLIESYMWAEQKLILVHLPTVGYFQILSEKANKLLREDKSKDYFNILNVKGINFQTYNPVQQSVLISVWGWVFNKIVQEPHAPKMLRIIDLKNIC